MNIDYLLSQIDNLDEKIVDYENEKTQNDLENLNDLIDNLNTMLANYKELNDHITGYQSGDFKKQKSVQLLAGNIQTSFDFIEEKEEEIADAYENLTKTYEQMEADYRAACDARVDAGQAEFIMGVAAATVGTLAIICTAGMATPIVVTAGVAGGGSILYGTSNMIEGGQEIHYGLKGDLYSKSFNPIRDTVFCGNEMAYNTWGSLSMLVAGICVPVGRAVNTVAGAASKEVTKTVMITVTKEKIKDGLAESGTRLIVNKLDEELNLNQTENVLLSGGLNIAFSNGLDKAEVKFGLGNNSFAADMSYDDALSYNKWMYDSMNGTNNHHPGMSDIDLNKWDLANTRIDESIAVSKIDTDMYSQLRAVDFRMSYDDAVLFNKWTDDCIRGTHNNHPGMSDIDLKKWDLADARLNESMAKSKVDVDAYQKLKAVDFNGNVEVLAATIKADISVKGGLKTPNYIKLGEELGKKVESEGYRIIDVEDAVQANKDWADMGYNLPPAAENTKVYNVEAGNFEYARVFKEGVNNPKSPFMLRADDIKGLSASEIAEKYALPQVPDRVVYPHIPSDTPLEISIAGPQKSWGTIGGDAQYAIKDALLDDDWFTDIQPLD